MEVAIFIVLAAIGVGLTGVAIIKGPQFVWKQLQKRKYKARGRKAAATRKSNARKAVVPQDTQ